MTFQSGMTRMNENTVPNVKNTDFTVTAAVRLGSGPANGAIVAQGGKFGGWSFYLKEGVPAYAHNWVGLETFVVKGFGPVPAETKELVLQFAYDGGGSGKGGTVTFLADGRDIGSGRVEKTVPALFSFDDFMDIGQDNGEPVVEDYGPNGATFTGEIDSVTIDVSGEAHHDHDQVIKAKYARQ